jgi:hypothetical protein
MDHDLSTVAFGVLVLWRPSMMTTPPLIERLATWTLAVRHHRAAPCLFCQHIWRDEAAPPPSALIFVRDETTINPQPVCETCAGQFRDDEALADQAMVLARYRWWPAATPRVYQESGEPNGSTESGEPKLVAIGCMKLG